MLTKRKPWNTGAAASTEVALEVAVCESSEFKLKCWGDGGSCERREACQGETQSWAQGAGLRCPGTHNCGREKEMEFVLQCLVPLQWEVRCPRGSRLQSQARLPEGAKEDGPLAGTGLGPGQTPGGWKLLRQEPQSSAQKYLSYSRHCRKEELHAR